MSPAKIRTGVASTGPTKVAASVLRRMVEGERLLGAREFPYPFKYAIGIEIVGVTIVDDLVTRHLITASHPVASRDSVVYSVTDAGREFVKHGAPKLPETQADWTADVGYIHPPVAKKGRGHGDDS